MIYTILRQLVRLLLFGFFRRMYWRQKQSLPKNGPLLIIVNHSTAFTEMLILGAFLPRAIYYWARASVFTNPWARWFYRQIHILPIMRAEEGLRKLDQNASTMQQSQAYLQEGLAVVIAPEGNCVMEKRLRHFRTGTARLALSTLAQLPAGQDLEVLPIGVNFSHHKNWRAEVKISIGERFSVRDFEKDYQKDPQRGAKLLTYAMREALAKEVIWIEREEDEELAEYLYRFARQGQGQTTGFLQADAGALGEDQRLTEQLNALEEEKKTQHLLACRAYFGALAKDKLPLAIFQPNPIPPVLFLLFLPLYLTGGLLSWPLFTVIRALRAHFIRSPKSQHFWGPMAMAFALISWIPYSLIWTILGLVYFGSLGLILPVLVLCLSLFYVRMRDAALLFLAKLRWMKLGTSKKENLQKRGESLLQALRQDFDL